MVSRSAQPTSKKRPGEGGQGKKKISGKQAGVGPYPGKLWVGRDARCAYVHEMSIDLLGGGGRGQLRCTRGK